ncbi:hypothetical protein BpHYR1_035969 [Brachionus plicatilis]|uniref:Uncharacterized protein n=1 Tax=Brachionus plicatilis TaxID=10195 RepID=A0A3M7QTP6_BRAPC|nr:hypothetical protein BpHYR1_035969 [Brachionus plicatilis]
METSCSSLIKFLASPGCFLHEYCLSGSYREPKYCLGRLYTELYWLESFSSRASWLSSSSSSLCLMNCSWSDLCGLGDWDGDEHSDDSDETDGEMELKDLSDRLELPLSWSWESWLLGLSGLASVLAE